MFWEGQKVGRPACEEGCLAGLGPVVTNPVIHSSGGQTLPVDIVNAKNGVTYTKIRLDESGRPCSGEPRAWFADEKTC